MLAVEQREMDGSNPTEENRSPEEDAKSDEKSQNGSSESNKSAADNGNIKKSPTEIAVRQYWEVPAVAHFCSLFREVFKLIDFDIEDLEEAYIVDCAPGARSQLIVDLLLALLKGLISRRDVSLLNYNQILYDLLEYRWVSFGLGVNPLGPERLKANFHQLPLCAKVKLLHYLCEWRLERPDVEVLTRNLTGESLRVNALGTDDQGNQYWYFYGTRLYCENPEPVKIKIPTPQSHKKRAREMAKKKKRQKSLGRKSKRRSIRTRLLDNKDDSDIETPKRSKKEKHITESDDEEASHQSGPLRGRRCSTRAEVVERSRTNSPMVNEETEDKGLRELVQRMYSGREDDNSSAPSRNSPVMHSDDSNSMTAFGEKLRTEIDAKVIEPKTEVTEPEPKETENESKVDETAAPDQNDEKVEQPPQPANEETEPKTEEPEPEKPEENPPPEPKGPPAWEQPLLLADPIILCRWHVICSNLTDWQELANKFEQSRSKQEKDLHKILRDEFLTSIEELIALKEKERQKMLAELAPKRSSDRLEVKRLQRQREVKQLERRENAERARLATIEEERSRKQEQGAREHRYRLRDLEKEKQHKLKDRARDERARRLESRQRRLEMLRAGVDVSSDLMNESNCSYEHDEELDQLDDQIEQEVMFGQLEKVLDAVRTASEAGPFLNPVTEEIAPDYFTIIEQPMDLSAMEDKLIKRQYSDKLDFITDLNLLLLNCLKYNGLDSEYTRLAQRLERVFIRAWRKYFPPREQIDNEQQRREQLRCISMLGALDKKIREELEGPSDSEVEMKPEPNAAKPPGLVVLPSKSTVVSSPLELKPKPIHTRPIVASPPKSVLYDARYGEPRGARISRPSAGPLRPRVIDRDMRYTPYSPRTSQINSPRVSSSPVQIRSPVKEKSNVYLLPGPGHDRGNRLLRFVTKDGQPAPADLVQQVLPQIKNDVSRFPAGKMVTVTLSVEGKEAKTVPVSTEIKKELDSAEDSPGTSGISTAGFVSNKLYHLGGSSYLRIENGQPYLMRKDSATNVYSKVKRLDRAGLVEKLRLLQQVRKGGDHQAIVDALNGSGVGAPPKPVCSVAPQRQSAPPPATVPISTQASSSQPVMVYQQAQTLSLPQGAQIITLPPGTRLVTQQSPSTQTVQVIQLQSQPQLMVSSAGSSQTLVLQQSSPECSSPP